MPTFHFFQAFPTTSTAEHPSSSSSTSPSGEYGAADSDSADGDCADGDCADGDGADRRREGNNEGGSRSADSDFPVVAEEDLPDVVFEVTIADREEENHTADEKLKEEQKTGKVDKSVQVANTTSLTFGCVSIENLSDLPGGFSYYTSFQDLDHFMYVFSCLGPASMHLAYQSQKLKPQDEFLLLMMKLRLNKDDQELAWFFGISTNTVSRIFKTWLNFLYYQLKELKIWNSRAIVDIHMPSDFQKKFPNTRVILDGSEVPIEKPSDLRNQSATWSNYKNRNTLKVMVGISPRGDISYISEVYGGATSDRQIVESSDLLRPGTFERGDSIMADRGFIVQDLFCLHNVHVNIPTVMRNMVQLPQEKVIQDRRIASKRVHVERMIGLAKTFRILKEELHHSYVPLGGRILFVCLALQNFRPSIMNNSA